MSEHRGSSSRYSSTASSIHYASLTSTKIKDLIIGRTSDKKEPKQKHIFMNKRDSMFHQHEGKVEKPSEDENSMFSNTDEHSKRDINTNIGELDPKLKVCCPFCHKRIDSVIEGLIQDIKNWGASNSVPDSQLSEKVKTHYFPAKKNLMTESLTSSQVFDMGVVNDVKVRPLSNRNVSNVQGPHAETAKSSTMSNLLYELAEHKAKLAAALHTNDENLYELQKRQTEIRQLQMNYIEKEKEYSKLEKEFFLVKQENYKCKSTIHELNTNHKMLLKDFNKFTKLQISLKAEAG